MEDTMLEDVIIKLEGVRDILFGLATGDNLDNRAVYHLLGNIINDCTDSLRGQLHTLGIE